VSGLAIDQYQEDRLSRLLRLNILLLVEEAQVVLMLEVEEELVATVLLYLAKLQVVEHLLKADWCFSLIQKFQLQLELAEVDLIFLQELADRQQTLVL
jgi:hypothetical protein